MHGRGTPNWVPTVPTADAGIAGGRPLSLMPATDGRCREISLFAAEFTHLTTVRLATAATGSPGVDRIATLAGYRGFPALPLADGERFAGYTIQQLLGAGAMGEVYLAQHPRLPRRDALKVLPAALTTSRDYRERFDREADIAASLWHPHIVGVHDRGEFDGQLWISMDYVDGTDAACRLRECPHGLCPADVLKIVGAVAEALDYAHQHHLLHRDVKPANILLARPKAGMQRILLADFGIARWTDDVSGLTETNMTVGTVSYMAPEQLRGSSIDGRADQYALAATAFHLLTGSPPFHPTNPAIAISQHLTATPPKLAERCPTLAGLDPALSTALAKEPRSRFESCADFARALGEHLATPSTKSSVIPLNTGRPTSPKPPPPRSVLRMANIAPLVCAGFLIVVIAVAVQLFSRDHQPPVSPAAAPPPSSAAPTPTSATATAAPSAAPAPRPVPLSPSPTPLPTPVALAPPRAVPAPPSATPPTRRPVAAASAAPSPPPPPPPPPALPAVVGARCANPGTTEVTAEGATAYCSRLQDTDRHLWSLNQGDVPNPLATAQPVVPQAGDNESAVRICVQQTGHPVLQCINEILRDNGFTR